MAANERGEAAGGIVASATVLIVSLATAVATSGGTLAFLAGIPRQLRAIAARIVKSVEQAGSKLKLAFSKSRPVKVDDALETIAEQKRTLAESAGGSPDEPDPHRRVNANVGKSKRVLDEWFELNRHDLRAALGLSPRDKLPRVISVVVDRRTGKVYFGYSGWPTMERVPEVDPGFLSSVRNRDFRPLEVWSKENCAEFLALDGLLRDRRKEFFLENGAFNEEIPFIDVEGYSIYSSGHKQSGFPRAACKNCTKLYPGVIWLSGTTSVD